MNVYVRVRMNIYEKNVLSHCGQVYQYARPILYFNYSSISLSCRNWPVHISRFTVICLSLLYLCLPVSISCCSLSLFFFALRSSSLIPFSSVPAITCCLTSQSFTLRPPSFNLSNLSNLIYHRLYPSLQLAVPRFAI